MTAAEYVNRVAFELRDLPWGMRRELIGELHEHLEELPAGTDLAAQLGPPEQYAADLRGAAGLERRLGPIAFLRARRPRNVVLAAVVLTVIGLAIGAVVWIQSYQPLATGNAAYGPLRSVQSPAGDGVYVVFRQGKPFRYGMTVWNNGRFKVRVLGVPKLFGLPISWHLLMSAPTKFNYGGIPMPYTRFHPFELKPGYERGLVLAGTYDEPCSSRAPGLSVQWRSIPVRYRFLWRTRTVNLTLPETVAFVFRKSSLCS